MIQSYLKVFWRQLKKRSTSVTLNLFGFSTAIATVLLITLYIQFQWGYDKNHIRHDQIYRIETPEIITHEKDLSVNWITTPMNLAPIAQDEIPGIEAYCRIHQFWDVPFEIMSGNTSLQVTEAYAADASFLEVFTLDFHSGGEKSTFEEPNTALVSTTLAERIFGTQDVSGLTIKSNLHDEESTTRDLLIVGVYEDLPENNHFRPEILISAETDRQRGQYYFNRFNAYTYLLLTPSPNLPFIEEQLAMIYDKHLDSDREPVLKRGIHALVPLTDIHMQASGSAEYVKVFGLIGILILVIAGITYSNILTAQVRTRLDEVATRKILGSSRWHILQQFLFESALFILTAIVLGLFLLTIALPVLNPLLDQHLEMWQLTRSPTVLAGIGTFIFFVGVTGTYPIIKYLDFRPSTPLCQLNGRNATWQQSLLIIQFLAVIFVLACTATIYRQIHLITHMDLGFDQDHMVLLNKPNSVGATQWQAFEQDINLSPLVLESGQSDFIPGRGGMVRGPISAISEGTPKQIFAYRGRVSPQYFETLDLEIKAGRNFDIQQALDSSQAVIVNEKLVEVYQLKDPIGHHIRLGGSGNPNYLIVIGVVEDFYQEPLYVDVAPQLFRLGEPDQLTVKIGQNIDEALSTLRISWRSQFPTEPFYYEFLDEEISRQYDQEKIQAKLFLFLCILTVFISFNGLFALSFFIAQQRVREVAIRKICGAQFVHVLVQFSRHQIFLILLSGIPALILSKYIISMWLERFAHRVSVHYGTFILCLLTTVLLTVGTIGLNAWRTFQLDPAKTLKEE